MKKWLSLVALGLAALITGCGSSSVTKWSASAIAIEEGLNYSEVIVEAAMNLDLGQDNSAIPSIDDWGQHPTAYWGDEGGNKELLMLFSSAVARSDVVAALTAAQARARACYDATWHGGDRDWDTAPESVYQGDSITVLLEWTDGDGLTHRLNLDDLFEERVAEGVRPFSPHWVFAAPAYYLQPDESDPGSYTGCFVCPWNCPGTMVPNNGGAPKGAVPADVPELRLKRELLGWDGTTPQSWALRQYDPLNIILRVHHSDTNEVDPTDPTTCL